MSTQNNNRSLPNSYNPNQRSSYQQNEMFKANQRKDRISDAMISKLRIKTNTTGNSGISPATAASPITTILIIVMVVAFIFIYGATSSPCCPSLSASSSASSKDKKKK
jgi:hypothetical protein